MATTQQTTLPGVEKSSALKDLVTHLTAAKHCYGSAKNFARMTIEDPRTGQEAVQAAKGLTEALRIIQTLG